VLKLLFNILYKQISCLLNNLESLTCHRFVAMINSGYGPNSVSIALIVISTIFITSGILGFSVCYIKSKEDAKMILEKQN